VDRKQKESMDVLKREIVVQIGNLSRSIGKMPHEDENVREAGNALLKLGALVSKALDIPIP
jgi:hypothetical protein